MKKISQITAWSFSRYTTYNQCPLKLKLSAIDRIKEPPNDAMTRGSLIHTLAEDHIKGKTKKLPPELKQFSAEFKKLKALYKKTPLLMAVEDNWSFTKDWSETQWNNWTECWVRIKLDCAHHEDGETLIITDWKTGKFRPEEVEVYIEQLELYALAAMLLYPHINCVKPRLVYLDLGITYPDITDELIFTRADVPNLKKLWGKRVKPMMSDKIFAPRPNDKCKWCFYRHGNKAAGGGQCKY